MMADFDYKAFADEARRRTMKDMTGGEYEEHLARVAYDATTRPAPKVDSALVGELRDQVETEDECCQFGGDGFGGGNIFREAADEIERLAALSDRDVVLEGLLREARERLRAIQGACGDYLPPDSGISEHDLANTVIGLTDDRTYISLITRIDAALKGGVDE